jgi:rhamnosyltransferase
MKSSTGQYYQALDHIRALAAFTVFAWHFNHFNSGQLAPPLAFPLSFFTEGHTGVAIFMTLSGYLFAKLLGGQKIIFTAFLWNRFLRLAPLLFLVIFVVAFQRYQSNSLDVDFLKSIAKGVVYPSLPNGGWSITVESHFYVILPVLLYLASRSKYHLLSVLLLSFAARLCFYIVTGEIRSLAYGTIVGRLDQFILGIFAFQNREMIKGKGYLVLAILISFLIFWYFFDLSGGFYLSSHYPSKNPIWLIMPLIEGLAYATLIAWYDSSYTYSDSFIAKFIAIIGTYSYSIYLLHFFVVFKMPYFINKYLLDLSNPYVLLVVAVPCFLSILPFSYLSYRFIESPIMRYRKRYFIEDVEMEATAVAQKVGR